MKTRAITGFFFIIVMLASVIFNRYVFDGFYLVLSVLCLNEFYSLVKKAGIAVNKVTGLINGAFFYAMFALITANSEPDYQKYAMLLTLTFGAVFVQELFKKSEAPFTNIAYTFLGLILIIVPFCFFHGLGYIIDKYNFHFPLAFLLMLWANDTGAYLVGMAIGKHKLFERHSPKKTWEGFIGGVLIAAGVGLLLGHYYKEIAAYHWAVIGIIIGVAGTTGDLVESMFKRSINVKDSGSILPGHGGLLDRFDGLFLAVPVVYTYLYLITN